MLGYSLVAMITDLWRIGIGAWQTVYTLLRQFLMAVLTEILSIETLDFLKRIIFFKSFNSVFFPAGNKTCLQTG